LIYLHFLGVGVTPHIYIKYKMCGRLHAFI